MNDVLGELLGTMILIVLGGGVVAGVVLKRTKAENAGWMVVTAGWAFAVMAGVYTARAVGAPGYINPVGPLAGVPKSRTTRCGQTRRSDLFLVAHCVPVRATGVSAGPVSEPVQVEHMQPFAPDTE